MNEYELHTQGARHSFEPDYDGRDPNRSRPCAETDSAPRVKRSLLRKYDIVYGLGLILGVIAGIGIVLVVSHTPW